MLRNHQIKTFHFDSPTRLSMTLNSGATVLIANVGLLWDGTAVDAAYANCTGMPLRNHDVVLVEETGADVEAQLVGRDVTPEQLVRFVQDHKHPESGRNNALILDAYRYVRNAIPVVWAELLNTLSGTLEPEMEAQHWGELSVETQEEVKRLCRNDELFSVETRKKFNPVSVKDIGALESRLVAKPVETYNLFDVGVENMLRAWKGESPTSAFLSMCG